jgi:catechol 2,3-dioxygenase-like lactoylglutathione lyase family enzyme
MAPFAVRGIDHVVYRVRDPERMVAFYQEVLGCRVDHRQEQLGLVHLRAGTALVDLVRAEGPLPEPEQGNVAHLCLRIDPWEPGRLADHFAALGIAITLAGANYGAEGTGPSLYLRDPEGNLLELKGPATHSLG